MQVASETERAGDMHDRHKHHGAADTNAVTHEQLVHQEARHRIQNAILKMYHENPLKKSAISNDQSGSMSAAHFSAVSQQSGHHAKTPCTARIWSPRQVEHVRQCTNELLSNAEGDLQCLIDCLNESSPGPVVIGAFLCSCQVCCKRPL